MYNLLISLFCSTAVMIAMVELGGQKAWVAGITSVVVFIVVYVLLMRAVMKKFGAMMEEAQRDVQAAGAHAGSPVRASGTKPGSSASASRNSAERNTSRNACTGLRSSRLRRLRKSYSSSFNAAKPRP